MLYIKSLSLENVKCFGKRQTIDFTQGEDKIAQWTVILGDNGAGKTTVLRSLVVALPEPKFAAEGIGGKARLSFPRWGLLWEARRNSLDKNAQIRLDIVEGSIFSGPFGRVGHTEIGVFKFPGVTNSWGLDIQGYDVGTFSPVFCFGYGASRKVSKKSIGDTIVEDVSKTLFDEEALIQNPEEYLLRLAFQDASHGEKNSDDTKKVKDLLIKVLPSGLLDIKVEEVGRLQWQVQVQTPYGWVPMNELSLGYKTTIAWLIDFATKMIYFHEKSANPFAEPAILIIDEIDLHMHPAWQREIIQQLTDLFPKTQFIVTAHSPLIAQAALDANIVVLKRDGDEVIVHNDPEIVRSWRIDQVLTSDLFGLKEARPQKFDAKIKRRQRLLEKAATLSEKESLELEGLNAEVDTFPAGETKLEMDAMDVLRDFAVKLEAAKLAQHDSH